MVVLEVHRGSVAECAVEPHSVVDRLEEVCGDLGADGAGASLPSEGDAWVSVSYENAISVIST